MFFENQERRTFHMSDIHSLIQAGKQWANDSRSVANARYLSWEHCYKTFAPHIGKPPTDEEADYLALHLGFYLASWGMYRASSFLFYRDYKVHIPVVKELLKPEYALLHNIKCVDYPPNRDNCFSTLYELSGQITDIYEPVRESYYNEKGKPEPETFVSEVLVTKVLMGTLGCTPAYDQYFVKGLKGYIKTLRYGHPQSMIELSELYSKHECEFEDLRTFVFNMCSMEYPQMKIVDMCFNQRGIELDRNKKNK
jgi:hypothetical protein